MVVKKNIQRSLYFVILKLIKKIDYYIDLIKNEFLNDSDQISSYQFQLFLIYNNKPILDINSSIKICIENLIRNNLITHEFFFQVIYAVPALSSLKITNLNEKIELANQEIEELKKNDKVNKEIIKSLHLKIVDLEKKISKIHRKMK